MAWLHYRVCLGWLGSAVSTPLTPTHTQSFRKCDNIYYRPNWFTAIDKWLIKDLCTLLYASPQSELFYQWAICLHDKYCAGSVRGARIRISVNSFCRQSQPHMEKCDSHYPSDSSEAVALGYYSPLQTRKLRVVLGTGHGRFPPSH